MALASEKRIGGLTTGGPINKDLYRMSSVDALAEDDNGNSSRFHDPDQYRPSVDRSTRSTDRDVLLRRLPEQDRLVEPTRLARIQSGSK